LLGSSGDFFQDGGHQALGDWMSAGVGGSSVPSWREFASDALLYPIGAGLPAEAHVSSMLLPCFIGLRLGRSVLRALLVRAIRHEAGHPVAKCRETPQDTEDFEVARSRIREDPLVFRGGRPPTQSPNSHEFGYSPSKIATSNTEDDSHEG
jgi:hypothetical protein